MSTPVAVVTALGSSLVLGISVVADQRSTKRVRSRRALSPQILADLVRQPLWLAAIVTNIAGFALQVVALTYGSIALVQPILVCDLVFASLIDWYLDRGRQFVPCLAQVVGVLPVGVVDLIELPDHPGKVGLAAE